MQKKSSNPDFWNDNEKASIHLKKTSIIEKELKAWNDLDILKDDVKVMMEFAESKEISLDEVEIELLKYKKTLEDIELRLILGDKQDRQNAILTIHPGAGGTESQD